MSEADAALSYLNAMAALAARLAAAEVAIYSLTYQSHAFGSWEIEAGHRRQRVRVSWQGKDRQLVVSAAELTSGSTERRWRLAEEHDYRDRRVDFAQLAASVEAAIRAHAGV